MIKARGQAKFSDARWCMTANGEALKTLRYLLTLLLLGVAVHLLLPQLASLEHALQVLRQMSPPLVLLALGAQTASYWGSGYLLQAAVHLVKQRITVYQGVIITLAANSMGLLGGGTLTTLAMTFHWVQYFGVNNQGAGLAGLMPLLFNNLFLLLLCFFGVVYLLLVHELSVLQFVAFTAVALGAFVLFLGVGWAVRHQTRLLYLAHTLGQCWATLRRRLYQPSRTVQAVEQGYLVWYHLRAGEWRRPVMGALLNNGFDILTLYLLFAAAGYPVRLSLLIVGYGLPLLLGKIGLLPGGVGVIEGAMATLYGSFGVPKAILVVVILAYRFLSFWLPTLIGFGLLPYLHCRAQTTLPKDA